LPPDLNVYFIENFISHFSLIKELIIKD